MKTLPRLFQKTQTGAIQQWTIGVDSALGPATVWGVLVTEHGQVGGKLQTTSDTIKEGKNPGKKNATTPLEQAEKEAKARWTKQLKKGYVDSVEAAEAGEVDAVIEGGLAPMLAPNKSYPKDDLLVKSIVFPCYFQPKLDGMRCIAIIEDGKCTLWSRTRKRINVVPHIVAALEKAFAGHYRIVIDGELYNHDYKDRFEDLMSILRTDEPDGDGEYLNAQYHVYDCPQWGPDELPGGKTHGTMEDAFDFRNTYVDLLFVNIDQSMPIKRVHTHKISTFEHLKTSYQEALDRGYEGGMARNVHGTYESDKRSKHLQKMKEFIDAEFKILGVNDGRGKDAGTVATFTVELPNGKTCDVRLKATYARRRELMDKPELWRGKKLTVNFKRWTADGSLYLPIGKAIRDYE